MFEFNRFWNKMNEEGQTERIPTSVRKTLEIFDEMFANGLGPFKILQLTREEAEQYVGAVSRFSDRYNAVSEPSIKNDTLRETLLYEVTITRRDRGDF